MREISLTVSFPGYAFMNVPGHGRTKVLNKQSSLTVPRVFTRIDVSLQRLINSSGVSGWLIDLNDLCTVVSAAGQLIDTAVTRMNSANAREARKFWFGGECGTQGNNDNQYVLTQLQLLQTRKNAIQAVLFASAGGTAYADTIMAAPRGGRSNSLPCIAPKLLLGAKSRSSATVSTGPVTMGMCIATVLHEYTHIFLNTDDVNFGSATGRDKPKVYGSVDARALAAAGKGAAVFQNNKYNTTHGLAGNAASAVNNAENWCFYLTEPLHRGGVTAGGGINWTGTARPPGARPPRPLTSHP